MSKTKSIANSDTYKEFEISLNAFQPETLEIPITKPEQIYVYYNSIESLYTWLRNAYGSDLQSIENEIRATLGHMSEYESDHENLQKAYGHIRRMAIDVLKILCNGLDKEFEEWIITHAEFDYNTQDNLYMPMYVKMYNQARKEYLDAQMKENMGSNRNNHIIEKYYKAAKSYGKLYEYHINKRRIKIHRYYIRMLWQRRLWIASTSAVTIISIIGYLMNR